MTTNTSINKEIDCLKGENGTSEVQIYNFWNEKFTRPVEEET